jgi:hypothetical protein
MNPCTLILIRNSSFSLPSGQYMNVHCCFHNRPQKIGAVDGQLSEVRSRAEALEAELAELHAGAADTVAKVEFAQKRRSHLAATAVGRWESAKVRKAGGRGSLLASGILFCWLCYQRAILNGR